jgi:tripartite-type tricarboxylate transporter receptor subunit TctC
VVEAIGTAAIRDKLAAQLMEPIGSSPAEFRARIAGEIDRWAPVIKAANIKVN